jgi:hypothetical protein
MRPGVRHSRCCSALAGNHARGGKITFRIEHPPFVGELYVKINDFRFFLSDTVWAPVEDKRGAWRLITWLDGDKVADETLDLV